MMVGLCDQVADGFPCTRDSGHGGWCEHENERGEIDHRWKEGKA